MSDTIRSRWGPPIAPWSQSVLTKLFTSKTKTCTFKPEVLDFFNDFIHYVCLRIFKNIKNNIKIIDIDNEFANCIEYDDARVYGNTAIADFHRYNELKNHIYTKDFGTYIQNIYNVTLTDIYVEIYLSGILYGFMSSLINIIVKKNYSVTDPIGIMHLEKSFNSNLEVEKFFEFLDFDPVVLAPITTSLKKNTVLKRLPKVWMFNQDTTTLKKTIKKYKELWVPGDMICPEDGYRGEDTIIIDRNNNPSIIMQSGNGAAYIPPWAVELAILNGFNLAEIIDAYNESSAYYLIYPRQFQGDYLEIDDKGNISQLLGWSYVDCIEDDYLNWDDVDYYTPEELFE